MQLNARVSSLMIKIFHHVLLWMPDIVVLNFLDVTQECCIATGRASLQPTHMMYYIKLPRGLILLHMCSTNGNLKYTLLQLERVSMCVFTTSCKRWHDLRL